MKMCLMVISLLFGIVTITGTFYYFLPQDCGEIRISFQIFSKADPTDIVFQSDEYQFSLKYSRFKIYNNDLVDSFTIPIPQEFRTDDYGLSIKEYIAIKGDDLYMAFYLHSDLLLTWGGAILNGTVYPRLIGNHLTCEVWNRNAGPDPGFAT